MDRDRILKLNVENLKHKLNELQLPSTGLKRMLQNRLLEHYNLQVNELLDEEEQFKEALNTDSTEPTLHSYSHFTLRDIQDSISTFNGTNLPKIDTWLQEFEDGAEAVGWNEVKKFIFAKQLLKGAAQLFIRSQAHINNWTKLKKALLEEFHSEISAADIHRTLSNKKKRYNQSCLEYWYEIMEIAKPIKLDEPSMIDFFIEGIAESRMNKAVLYKASTKQELKEKIKVYEQIRGATNFYPMKRNFNDNYSKVYKKGTRCPHLSNHSTEECKKLKNVCFNCNKPGHRAVDCRSNHMETTGNKSERPKGYTNNNRNYLRRKNNYNDDCNQNQHDKNSANDTTKRQACRSFVDNRMIKEVSINGRKFWAMIDTGSDLSFLEKSVYESLGITLFQETVLINGLGGGMFKTLGYILAQIEIDETKFIWIFHVANDSDLGSTSIIGCDIFDVVDITFTKSGVTLLLKEEQRSLEDVLFDEMLGPTEEMTEKFFIFGQEFKSLCTNRTIETNFDIGYNIGPARKRLEIELANIINGYKPNKIKSTNVEMKIILKDDIPVYQRPKRLPIQDQKIIEKQVEEWKKTGIVKNSQSEYASPVVIVAKKDGTKRLCCDYRKINNKMIRDNFPMALIDNILRKLQGAFVYTTLDLKNGFFHVPVEKESQKYTSFVTHHGQFEFTKTPFGMANSPAVFCRYIAAVFQELIQKDTVIIYMDDLVIPSQTASENLLKLKEVLKVASEYGLEINLKKC